MVYMRMKCQVFLRKCFSVSLTVLMAVGFLFPAMPVSAEERVMEPVKKIVSVVYDDSGSMNDPIDRNSGSDTRRWSPANYALQGMAALMNEKDEFHITLMNNKSVPGEVDLSKKVSETERIRKDYRYLEDGGTPLDPVDEAMDTLMSIQDDDPSTQYWLFVLTDGEFKNDHSTKYIGTDTTIQDVLNKYKGKKMPNGSTVQIQYLRINKGKKEEVSTDSANGLVADYCGSEGITEAMSAIANRISGRLRFEANSIEAVDSRSIRVHSDLPMYSISVLSQNSRAKVTGAEGTQKLKAEQNIPLIYPTEDASDASGSEVRDGNAAILSNGASVIPAGDYTISFSEDVDPKNVDILYEPAIGLEIHLINADGAESDFRSGMPGDEVEAKLALIDPSTGEEIDQNALPEGCTWHIGYIVDGNVVKEEDDSSINVQVQDGINQYRGTFQIPGYAPLVYQTEEFECIQYRLEGHQPEEPVVYRRAGLGGGSEGGNAVTFTVYGNDVPLTKSQLKNVELKITEVNLENPPDKAGPFDRFGIHNVSCRLKLADDGTFTLTPTAPFFLAPFLVRAGDYRAVVTLDVNGETAEARFSVKAGVGEWTYIIILAVLLFLILYILYLLFIKYKFNDQRIIVDYYKRLSDGTGVKQKGKGGSFRLNRFTPETLLPRRASHKNRMGLEFIADGMSVRISGKSLKHYARYCQGHWKEAYICENLEVIIDRMKKTKTSGGKPLEVQDIYMNRQLCLMRNETDKEVIILTMEK